MAQRTRMPSRLRELFAALNNDSLLIQECLVRPILVERQARRFFDADARIHAEARGRAESLRAELIEARRDPFSSHPARRVTALTREADPDAYDRLRARSSSGVGEIGEIEVGSNEFFFRVVLEEETDE